MKKATKKTKSLSIFTPSGAVFLIFALGVLLFVGPELFGGKAKCLVISEILTENTSAAADVRGNFSDCIEISNKSTKTVNLKGIGLTDKDGKARYIFPDTKLDGGEALLVFCGSDLPFSLKSEGETVRLLSRTGKTVSEVTTVRTKDNQSLALIDGEYRVTDQISPGFPNTEDGIARYTLSRMAENPALVISEFIPKNYSILAGCAQLVEIQNISGEAVNLSGCGISDTTENLKRFPLPEKTLAPGEVMLFSFGTEDADAPFRFSDTESVYLTDKSGKICSEISAAAEPDTSIVRLEDEGYAVSDAPTPGLPNTEENEKNFVPSKMTAEVYISEVLSSNKKYLTGPDGEHYDIVEIGSRSASSVDLSEWYLSDDPDNLTKAQLYGTLPAGGYKVFLCSKNETQAPAGYEILPLALSADGDALILSKQNVPQDGLGIPALSDNQSYGLSDDGKLAVLSSVTLGSKNAAAAKNAAMPSANYSGGVYNSIDKLLVELSGEGTIHYTTDCTIPTASSKVYTGPIELTKTGVIRARCYQDGCSPSEVFTATYIINENHSLEVACLVSEPHGLFSESAGIFAYGPGASDVQPYKGANFWKGWERESVVSFYPKEGDGFQAPCGITIFGGMSKAFDQRSVAVHFRSKYGLSKLEYPLFGEESLEEYDDFVFRSSGQDVFHAHMRDALITSLFDDMLDNTLVQNYRPVVLYINGQYWGVYYIREKINTKFVGGHVNADPDSIIINFQKGSGSPSWWPIVTWARSHDMSKKENLEYIESKVNIESYVNYLIAEIYCGNFDIGNVRFFSTPDYDNGRWNWILYDVDWGLYYPDRDSVYKLLSNNAAYSHVACNDLVRELLKNKEFKDYFLTEFARQLNEVWSPENVNRYVDDLYARLQPEMERECKRWNWSYTHWENQVQQVRTVANGTASMLYPYIKDYFNLTDAQMKAYGFRQ